MYEIKLLVWQSTLASPNIPMRNKDQPGVNFELVSTKYLVLTIRLMAFCGVQPVLNKP